MFRLFHTTGLVSLALLAFSTVAKPGIAIAQDLPTGPNQAKPIDPNDPNVIRPQGQDLGILSLEGGQKLVVEATTAVKAENYTLAAKKLQEARQVFNQLSNFYQELTKVFSGIDNRVSDSNRKKAFEAAQARDNATYQLALVHRAQNQPELAIPLLVQIVQSQQPTRPLGQQAYQQLLELGFVDLPYPRPKTDQPTSSSPNP